LSISKTRIPAMTGTFALPGPCRTTSSDRYCNDGASTPEGITGGHYDHVHISVY